MLRSAARIFNDKPGENFMAHAVETTALIIEHIIKKGDERRYEKWMQEILNAVSQSPGYLGREVFPPPGDGKPYTIVVRFQTAADSKRWLDSNERKSSVEKMKDAFETGDQTTVKAGIDVWFTPENSPNKPPAYKQFLLTAAAIYPLSLVVPRLLSPLFEAAPVLKNQFLAGLIVSSIITALMTYLIMPRLTDWLRGWLFAAPSRKEQTNL